jgi:hypothetical protein
MGGTISQSFDSGVDLETQDKLFISGVGVHTEGSINTITGYYISPYGKTISEYVYKPVTGIISIMGSEPTTSDNPNIPTTEMKFSPGYFLSNVKRIHTLDKESGIEEETITFFTKNHEKNIEEVTLKVQTMLNPGDSYKVISEPDPTKCLDGQFIDTLDQKFSLMSNEPRTFSHTCQDAPVLSWTTNMIKYKKPIGATAILFIFLVILYFILARSVAIPVAIPVTRLFEENNVS